MAVLLIKQTFQNVQPITQNCTVEKNVKIGTILLTQPLHAENVKNDCFESHTKNYIKNRGKMMKTIVTTIIEKKLGNNDKTVGWGQC